MTNLRHWARRATAALSWLLLVLLLLRVLVTLRPTLTSVLNKESSFVFILRFASRRIPYTSPFFDRRKVYICLFYSHYLAVVGVPVDDTKGCSAHAM